MTPRFSGRVWGRAWLSIGILVAGALTLGAAEPPAPRGEISGLVVDDRGEPVVGAVVSEAHHAGSVKTDERGTFVLPDRPAGTYDLVAEFPPWTRQPAHLRVQHGEKPSRGIVLRLTLGASLRGRVLGADEDLGAVRIVAWQNDQVVRTQPNRLGDYGLDALNPGHWRLAAQLPGGRLYLTEAQAAAAPPPTVVDLIFGNGQVLRGRVFQEELGIAEARVETLHLATGIAAHQFTDDQGYYKLPDLPKGVYRLTLSVAGRERQVEEIELEEDEHTLDIELGDAELAGQVIDYRGRPVLGAHLELVRRDLPAAPTRELQSDLGGAFLATDLADGTWRLSVRHPLYLPTFERIELENGRRTQIVIQMLNPDPRQP